MSKMLNQFNELLGKQTKQKGRFWCIPASISNALRILGGNDFSQEIIRDIWCAHKGVQPNADVNAVIPEISFAVMDALKKHPKFNSDFGFEFYSDNGDQNPFD